MEIDKTLETMNEEWERLSEKFRYQNGMFYLYDIVENFLGQREDFNDVYDLDDSNITNENDKYIQMNNMGTMEVVKEESSPESHDRNLQIRKININSISNKSPSFLEKDTLQIMNHDHGNHYRSSTGSKEDGSKDAMTFGGFSNRYVNVPGDGTRQIHSFDPMNSIDTGEIKLGQGKRSLNPNMNAPHQLNTKNFHSNSFGTPQADTAQKNTTQTFAHESMDTNRGTGRTILYPQKQEQQMSGFQSQPNRQPRQQRLTLKSSKDKLSRSSSKKHINTGRSKSPLMTTYNEGGVMKESMNLNNNVPINAIGGGYDEYKPLKSILKSNNLTSLNPSNGSTQKTFIVNNLGGAAHEQLNFYERGSINSSETLPVNTLNNLNSTTNLNIGSFRNNLVQPQQITSTRRVVQNSSRQVTKVSKSPALKIVGDARSSYSNSARRSYTPTQQQVQTTVYPNNQNTYVQRQVVPQVQQFVTSNQINSNRMNRNSSDLFSNRSHYTSVQSNGHVHIQSLQQPSSEIEYNNYHPGTGINVYNNVYGNAPQQSQNLAKLVPEVRDYGSPNVKKLSATESRTQFINPDPLIQPFNPPKRLIHHAHKQPISSLFKCTPIVLPEGDVGLNQIVAKSSDRILGATVQGDIVDYNFHLNQGESSNIQNINGREDEEPIQAYGQIHISTLDHIKDMIVDTEDRVIFSQLLSGVFISARNHNDGNQYIGPCCQNLLPGRSIIYAREFEELIVVSSNSRVESYSQNEEYKRSNYLAIDIPPGSGDIKHVLPGRVNKTKAFIMTDQGHIVHVGSDEGIAHIQFQAESGKLLSIFNSILTFQKMKDSIQWRSAQTKVTWWLSLIKFTDMIHLIVCLDWLTILQGIQPFTATLYTCSTSIW